MYLNKKRNIVKRYTVMDDLNDLSDKSFITDRTDQDWYSKYKKPPTFHQAKLKQYYKSITKAITEKRSYKMTNWRA